MRIGSLFSGAGGLDMAVEQVFGGTTVWHSEIDKAASKVLAHRWPGVPNLGDITTVDWSEVPAVDILCGGFPCQDVSAAGRRAGIKDGTRSGLWAVFADAIDHLRPPVVVIENVRGLLSATAHRMEPGDTTVGNGAGRPALRAAGAVLGDLADLGYDAQWATVAAADIGAPHRRERVFIVATNASSGELQRRGGRPAVAGASGRGEGAAEQRQRDGDATECGGATAPDSGGAAVTLLPTPAAADGQRGQDFARAGRDGSGGDDLVTLVVKATQGGLLLPTPQAADGGRGPSADIGGDRDSGAKRAIDLTTVASREMTQWGKYEPAIRRWEHLTGPAPAPTEPNKNGNPRLSAAFSQWLMGWPDGWVTDPAIGLSRNDQLRIVGNGVCPQQAAAALRYLIQVAGGAGYPAAAPAAAGALLPTPRATDGPKGGPNQRGSSGDLMLPSAVCQLGGDQ
jgi:DNA (cytosine-5)-methyltransferase 1